MIEADLPNEVGELVLASVEARRERRACKEAWFRIDRAKGEEGEELRCEDWSVEYVVEAEVEAMDRPLDRKDEGCVRDVAEVCWVLGEERIPKDGLVVDSVGTGE